MFSFLFPILTNLDQNETWTKKSKQANILGWAHHLIYKQNETPSSCTSI